MTDELGDRKMNQETRVNESTIKVDKNEQIKGDKDRLRNIRYKFGYIRKDRNELMNSRMNEGLQATKEGEFRKVKDKLGIKRVTG